MDVTQVKVVNQLLRCEWQRLAPPLKPTQMVDPIISLFYASFYLLKKSDESRQVTVDY